MGERALFYVLTIIINVNTIIRVRITFDQAKDATNVGKHGVSLALADQLDWNAAVVWEDRRRDYGETRFVALAPHTRRLYCVAFTQRAGMRRIISVRKANRREIELYENEADSTEAKTDSTYD